MYLSRIVLDETKQKTIMALSQIQIFHAAVERCFPTRSEDKPRNLWRIDRVGGHLYLVILSHEIPDFKDFSSQFSPCCTQGETKSYDPFLGRVTKGEHWRFRLTANPVRSVKDQNSIEKSRGKIQACATIEQQKRWLLDKASKSGFALGEDDFEVTDRNLLKFRRGEEEVTLQQSVFEGILTVTDKETFADALTKGIGRGKAYGCGLLTIARLQ